jgi:hypothetical protein
MAAKITDKLFIEAWLRSSGYEGSASALKTFSEAASFFPQKVSHLQSFKAFKV